MSSDKELEILYNYEYLLERGFSKLPTKRSLRAYDIPSLDIEHIGDQTVIKNFKDVCERLRRDPRIVMRFLLKELAMPGAVDERGVMVIYRRVSPHTVNALYNKFLEAYVKCPTCGSYDTELIRHGKVWYIKCLACGAETFVKPV